MDNNYLKRNKEFALNKSRSLAPDHFDDYEKNSELLRDMIESGTATNIGIVSRFGGGKSSFIKTFIDNNKNIKTTSVSVANIVGDSFDSEKVESLIIKQLIFSKKPSELPDSRIKRIGQRPKKSWYILSAVFIAVSLLAFALFSAFVAQPANITNAWFGGDEKNFLITEFSILGGGVAFVAIGLSFLFYNIKSFSLKFKDLEITKNDNTSETPFFKYFDELVYFFKKTKTRVIFFEDLDRLVKNYNIFDKLRELNIVLNSSLSTEQNKKIAFIYACGDEIFKTKAEDKNKYFDFVFNLEPILTKENCASIILTNKVFEPLQKWLSDTFFIDRISYYFEEMRVLLSVYNDCLIFVKNLNDSKLEVFKPTEIFTMMTYRTLFPEEYKKLSEGEGKLDMVIKDLKATYKVSRPFNYLATDVSIISKVLPSDKHREFLSMIIKYGYLTENYKDYILRSTAADSLSTDELEFLKDLNSSTYNKGSYFRKFENMKRLYSMLEDNDFKDVHILNKCIIDDYINNRLENVRDVNIQQAFMQKKQDDINYVDDFIVNYLQGAPEEPKEPGDSDNKLFYIKVAKYKTDLLRVIFESDKIKEDVKKDLITDFVFAFANNNAEFVRQEKFIEGIRLVQNYERFRKGLRFFDWTIQYFDKQFEKINITDVSVNADLIKKLVPKNCIVLNSESIHEILNAYGQTNNNYLKGHYVFNVAQTVALFNYFENNKESYFDILLNSNSNQVGINSLSSYCNSRIKASSIDQLIGKRDKNAQKLSLDNRLSPTAIISGLANDIFVAPNLTLFISTLNISVANFKDEIVASNLILRFLSLATLDNSFKSHAIKMILNKNNCTDEILQKIAGLRIVFDNDHTKQLISLTDDSSLKITVIYSCATDKKTVMMEVLPKINDTYKTLFENGKVKINVQKLETLPGLDMVKEVFGLTISKNKESRTIKI